MNNILKVLRKLIYKETKKAVFSVFRKNQDNVFKKLITEQFILISVKGYARKKENRGECYTFIKDYFIILDKDYFAFHERQFVLMDMGCLTL